jgi:predicted Fe-Mo cluster-binding NifX family protein
MKVCIPIKEYQGFESLVYGHFGSAPVFFIYDTDEDTFNVIENKTREHAHGKCTTLDNFRNDPIDVMVSSGLGIRALQNLNYAGVQVLKTEERLTVKDILELLKADSLKVLTLDDACMHHH